MNVFYNKNIIEKITILSMFIISIYLVSFFDLQTLTLKVDKEQDKVLNSYIEENEELKVLVINRHYTSPNLSSVLPLNLKTEVPKEKQEENTDQEYAQEEKEVFEEKEVEENISQEPIIEQDSFSDTPNNNLGNEIAEFSKQFVGNPYVAGGTSLTNGADCSGFTMSIFANFGISIARTSYDQINSGYQVSIDNIAPGDLVLSGYDGIISHSSMYIGDNQIIHALNENVGIVITDMYIMPIIAIVRVI